MPKIHSLKQLAFRLNQSISLDGVINSFCCDSRKIQPGDIFLALPGKQVAGTSFIEEAFQKGAIGAISNQSHSFFSKPIFLVDDVLSCIQQLAKDLLLELNPKHTVAITGSLGKTTTKEFISTLLEKKYKTLISPGNSNSQIGLPLTILNLLKGDEDIAVFEMGMTHSGNISQLIQIAPPDIAVITKVSLVHAENFSHLSEIAKAKGEIFKNKKTKWGVYDSAIDAIYDLSQLGTCQKIKFGLNQFNSPTLRIKENILYFSFFEEEILLKGIENLASHHLHNLLASLVIAKILGLTADEINEQLPKIQLPERRGTITEKRGVIFINDTYNAASESVCAALKSLPKPKKLSGKKMAVLGSMLELGKFSYDCHLEVGKEAFKNVDHLLCLGNECLPMIEFWQDNGKKAFLFKDKNSLVMELRKLACVGDIVLLKGSRSLNMSQILEDF